MPRVVRKMERSQRKNLWRKQPASLHFPSSHLTKSISCSISLASTPIQDDYLTQISNASWILVGENRTESQKTQLLGLPKLLKMPLLKQRIILQRPFSVYTI